MVKQASSPSLGGFGHDASAGDLRGDASSAAGAPPHPPAAEPLAPLLAPPLAPPLAAMREASKESSQGPGPRSGGGGAGGPSGARPCVERRPSKGTLSVTSSEFSGGSRGDKAAKTKRSKSGIFEKNERDQNQKGVFCDVEEMKRKVRENLTKPTYDVSMYYHKVGLWRTVATANWFEKLTLLIIFFNACWIGVDTDWNHSDMLLKARTEFQIAEHFFCIFFSFEWFARFMSFERKNSCCKDAWFVFDSVLVCMMVMESWVLSIVILLVGGGSSQGMGNASILRMARLARLSRMARMARLLRAMPELMILIKGIMAAIRSVFFTLVLLCLLMYVFAVAFTQLTDDTDVGREYFSTVGESMYTLLVYGTLMDSIGQPLRKLGKENYVYGAIFLLFTLAAALTLMNMLIGVLTEVVSAVAATEKEQLTVTFVQNKMNDVLKRIDQDSNNMISKHEFMGILGSKEATEALNEVGVDVVNLVDFADFIFAEEDGIGEKELSLQDFMKVVLQFRGTNNATVKDIVDLRKSLTRMLRSSREQMQELKDMVVLRDRDRVVGKTSSASSARQGMSSRRSQKSGARDEAKQPLLGPQDHADAKDGPHRGRRGSCESHDTDISGLSYSRQPSFATTAQSVTMRSSDWGTASSPSPATKRRWREEERPDFYAPASKPPAHSCPAALGPGRHGSPLPAGPASPPLRALATSPPPPFCDAPSLPTPSPQTPEDTEDFPPTSAPEDVASPTPPPPTVSGPQDLPPMPLSLLSRVDRKQQAGLAGAAAGSPNASTSALAPSSSGTTGTNN